MPFGSSFVLAGSGPGRATSAIPKGRL